MGMVVITSAARDLSEGFAPARVESSVPKCGTALAGSSFNTTDEYGRATAISRQPQIQFRAGFGYNLRRAHMGAEA